MINRCAVCVLFTLLTVLQGAADAQTAGNTAVYNQTTNAATPSYSPAYIDASALYYYENSLGLTVDFCTIINNILTQVSGYPPYPTQGAVIDARGILNIPNNGVTSPLQCLVNPFFGMTGPAKATILLPAATISIKRPWVIPSETKIVGAGRSATSIGVDPGFAFPTGDTTNAIIQMGSSTGSNPDNNACGTTSNVCTGISIEHLTVSTNVTNGTTSYYHAIYNNDAQDASYVDDVVITAGQTSNTASSGPAITTGLLIGPGATYSGPYTNIDFVGSTACTTTCQPTACVQIQAQTRGLHGITCTAKSTQTSGAPLAAIYLDSYNNTISDVHTEGFYDSIVVGDYKDLQPLPSGSTPVPKVVANTVSNVTMGYGTSTSGPSWETIHICNPAKASSATTACTQNTSGAKVSDVSLAQIESNGTSGFFVDPIGDDLTGNTFASLGTQQFVGKYVVGESITVNSSPSVVGYTRYTTGTAPSLPSWNIPYWGIGQTAITGACNSPGAIYSHTQGGKQPGVQDTFYVCAYNTTTSSLQWMPIG